MEQIPTTELLWYQVAGTVADDGHRVLEYRCDVYGVTLTCIGSESVLTVDGLDGAFHSLAAANKAIAALNGT